METFRIWWRQQNLTVWSDRVAFTFLGLMLYSLWTGAKVQAGIFLVGFIVFLIVFVIKNWGDVGQVVLEQHPEMVEAGVKQVVVFLLPEGDRYILYTTDGRALRHFHKSELSSLIQEYGDIDFGEVRVDSNLTTEQIIVLYWKGHTTIAGVPNEDHP